MKQIFVRILLVFVVAIPPAAISVVYVIAKKEQAANLAKWDGVEPAGVPRNDTPAALVLGEQIYRQHCATCHGPEGDGGLGKALNHAGLAGDPGHAYLMTVLANGIPTTPMASWKGVFGPADAAALAAYVQTFVPKAATPETDQP